MPPELAPIVELRVWYEAHAHAVKHKDLARSLKLSPQQLAELFGGRNQPTGIQVLAILEFLRTNTMVTVDAPKSLSAALDRIEVLTAELKELKAGKATALSPATIQKPPAVTVPPPIAPRPPSPLPVAAPPDINKLRSQLNAEKDATKRHGIYLKIKAAEREQRGPQPVARWRAAV